MVGLALPRVLGRELGKWKGSRHAQEIADVRAKCGLFLPFVPAPRCYTWTLGSY